MRSEVAVQLSGIYCSSSKQVGEKVRVGCAWSNGGGKAQVSSSVFWTPLCILQKPQTLPPTQSGAGWSSAAESPLSRGAATSFPNVEVSNQAQLSFSIEVRGIFSSTVVCTIVVDVHELVFSGTLSGPFLGASTTNGGKTKWMVTGVIQLKEMEGATTAPIVGNMAAMAVPPLQQPQLVIPPSILLTPMLRSVTPPPLLAASAPVAVAPAVIPEFTGCVQGEHNDRVETGAPQTQASTSELDLPKSVRDALDALEFPPFVAAKIFARGGEPPSKSLSLGNRRQPTSSSRIAAIILAPCRDATLSEEDLAFMCDSFSVELGHSVVTTVGGNSAISSALWRPELASSLNTAGKEFGTNARTDVATQTGDLAQLLSREYVAQFDSAAAVSLRTDAKEKLENSRAFQILKHDIAEANRREMQAVAEAQQLRVSLAKAMQQIDELRNGSTEDDDEESGLYGVPAAYRTSRRQRAGSSASSYSRGGLRNVWNDVLSSSAQSAVSTPSNRKQQRPLSQSPPTVRPLTSSQQSSFKSKTSVTKSSSAQPHQAVKTPLSQHVFQTGSQVGVRGRSRSIGFSDDDIL
ncbi:Hypothetical protein, putative [Bodo saltans]|uniref:Uncharacterized protein n=1 Tax=Bodo saltans TaxID=75058 RepID=A0A0S4JV91_BODSA|nr:Hypothetical protein, putative [Bodo saltans]|eukprot:CUG94141.1 Hypothetical protein, putative [Bodo saltans]